MTAFEMAETLTDLIESYGRQPGNYGPVRADDRITGRYASTACSFQVEDAEHDFYTITGHQDQD
jgi:hypothetical protein